VDVADGYYQDYVDSNGKKKTTFVQTGKHTEMKTGTEFTFNFARFAAKYQGRMFRFSCPDDWHVQKVERDVGIILKAGGMGSVEINANAPTSNRGALNSLRKGQKVSIKGVLNRYDAGRLFVPKSFHLDDVEILN
jgi:hypothetical protein